MWLRQPSVDDSVPGGCRRPPEPIQWLAIGAIVFRYGVIVIEVDSRQVIRRIASKGCIRRVERRDAASAYGCPGGRRCSFDRRWNIQFPTPVLWKLTFDKA